MRAFIIAVSAAALLTGCQTPEERMAANVASCQKDYGLKKGSPEFAQCLAFKEAAKAEEDRRAANAISASMQSMSNSMQRQAAQSPRPVNCTYTGYGNTVRQYCY